MHVTDAIETLQTHLSDRLTVPVQTSGMQDERPVPLVLIEDWDIIDHRPHNTSYAGQAVDPNDGIEKLWYRFYYDLRIELLIRHNDEVAAHRLLDDVRTIILMIQENPYGFHPHLNELQTRGGGGIHHEFLEPKETELNQALVLKTFHQTAEDNFDTIEEVLKDITIN